MNERSCSHFFMGENAARELLRMFMDCFRREFSACRSSFKEVTANS